VSGGSGPGGGGGRAARGVAVPGAGGAVAAGAERALVSFGRRVVPNNRGAGIMRPHARCRQSSGCFDRMMACAMLAAVATKSPIPAKM
jgi:hypothetical protein